MTQTATNGVTVVGVPNGKRHSCDHVVADVVVPVVVAVVVRWKYSRDH